MNDECYCSLMNKEKNLYYLFTKAKLMEDILDIEDFNLNSGLDQSYEICVPPHLMSLAENLYSSLFTSYGVRGLMNIVAKNRDKNVYVFASRNDPENASVIIDTDNKHSYSFNETLYIPVPKKFAILEPDKHYFEMTLKANILLSLLEADEKELHR